MRVEAATPSTTAPAATDALAPASPYLVFLGDVGDVDDAKTAFGLRDWCADRCVGQWRLPGCTVTTGLPDLSPKDAVARGARSLVIGIAPAGGQLARHWVAPLVLALEAGLDLVSGMHARLAENAAIAETARRTGRRLVELRHPRTSLPVATGEPRSGRRLLTVGTDCALGKKYTALALARELARRGVSTTFRATGQTGILIDGHGVAIDAVVADFVAGAAEWLSPPAAPDHWDVIEGQGSLLHPAYAGVSLGLLHGSQPDAFVVCHDPARTSLSGLPRFPVPSVETLVRLTIELGRVTNPAIRCVGVSLNLSRVPPAEHAATLADHSARLGVPSFDPMRGGVERVVDHLLT